MAAVLAMVLSHAAPAGAEPRRLAVLGAGPSLKRSVDVALDPWDVDVLLFDEAAPDALAPDAVERAEAIARAHGVDAVAWFRRDADETVLWLFDARTRSIHQRVLSAAALAESARDASLALSLKTLLRSSAIAAAPERHDVAVTDVPVRAEEAPSPSTAAVSMRVEAAFALRAPLDGAPVEPRVELGIVRWLAPSWAVGAALGIGPGVAFDEGGASGSRTDTEGRASLRLRVPVWGALSLEPRLGASLHVEAMRTTRPATETTESNARVNPSLEAGLGVALRLSPHLELALAFEGRYALRYQRLLLGEHTVFGPSPVSLQPAASIGWSF